MSQESFLINFNYLKHLRDRSEQTIEEVAEKCGIASRQYQRIEKHGRTTKKTAIALANIFNVSVEELQNDQPIDKSPWFLKTQDDFYGKLITGCEDVIAEVSRAVNVGGETLNNEGCVLLEINDNQLPISLKVTIHPGADDAYISEWLIRPAIISDTGIIWASLSEWQRLEWSRHLDKLSYDLAQKVIVNNRALVPHSSKIGFNVRFEFLIKEDLQEEKCIEKNKLSPSGKRVIGGTQFFQNEADFRSSLTEWLEENSKFYPLAIHDSLSGVLIVSLAGLADSRLLITKSWMDESNQAQKAPWPQSQREQLAEAIEARTALPLAFGELWPESFPALAPDRENGRL